MTQQLIITLRPDGGVEAETVGVTGDACLDYIGVLEEMLEADTVESKFTADYTAVQQQETLSARQRNGGAR